jgi:outer membrane protein insertion porin family
MKLTIQKRFLWLLLSIFIFCGIVFSANQKVLKINIEGNKRVSANRILLLLRTKVDRPFNSIIWQQDITRLSLKPYFSKITYKIKSVPGGVDIKLMVVENPKIYNIIFSKTRIFNKKDLKNIFKIKIGDFYQSILVKKAIKALKKKYAAKGYYFTHISYTKTPGPPGYINLYININDGPLAHVRKIVFIGNKHFSSDKLRGIMAIKQRWWPFIMGTYKPDIFVSDMEHIIKFYNDHGFPDCKIIKKSVKLTNGMLNITITLNEGHLYRFGEVNFQGNLIFQKSVLQKDIKFKTGQTVSNKKLDETMMDLKGLYLDKGYLNINIMPIPEIKNHVMNYTFYITPGERIRVNQIIITGNTITEDKVIRRQVYLYPGEYFSVKKIRHTYYNLTDLGYFKSVNIYPQPTSNPEMMNLVVDVKEKSRTGTFMIGGGYSSLQDVIGLISIEQPNFAINNPPSFTGGGQDLKLWLEIGSVTHGGELSFTEPYFEDKPIWLGFDIFDFNYVWTDYTEKHVGADIRVGKRWKHSSLGFTIKSQDVGLSDIQIPVFQDQAGTKRINSITATYTIFNINRPIMPTKGDKFSISPEISLGILGGQIDYYRLTAENDFYFPLKKWTFSSKTYLGYEKTYGSTSTIGVPLYERFFGGGIDTNAPIRGYQIRSVGPQSDGYVIGGTRYFAQNSELLYPLKKHVLWGVVFWDVGNVWDTSGIPSMLNGVGLGLRIKIPLFPTPIKVDYGWALDRQPGMPSGAFDFGMSMGF